MCECERLISGFMAHLGNKLGVQSVKLLGVNIYPFKNKSGMWKFVKFSTQSFGVFV